LKRGEYRDTIDVAQGDKYIATIYNHRGLVGVAMPQVQLDDQVFKVAQKRAADSGYASIDDYIADMVVQDVSDDTPPDLDHRFTPEVVAHLEKISAGAGAGEKTYSPDEISEHFATKSAQWRVNHKS
jgi:hypothetical protein